MFVYVCTYIYIYIYTLCRYACPAPDGVVDAEVRAGPEGDDGHAFVDILDLSVYIYIYIYIYICMYYMYVYIYIYNI